MQERIFNQMPEFVEGPVVIALHLAVFLGRNDNLHASTVCFVHNRIRIITTISQQRIGMNAFDQSFTMRTIRCGTFCNKHSDRHTMRIHGQMYLGIEPPFVRLMS